MRRLIFVLLIALLPLRGWVGDAMATEMATQMAAQMATRTTAQVTAGPVRHAHQPPAAAIKNVAAHAHGTGAEAHSDHETGAQQVAAAALPAPSALHDCNGHGGAVQASGATGATEATGVTADDSAAHAAGGECESCAACQACHTVALTLVAAALSPVFGAPALPRAAASTFASADTALGQKPPIS